MVGARGFEPPTSATPFILPDTAMQFQLRVARADALCGPAQSACCYLANEHLHVVHTLSVLPTLSAEGAGDCSVSLLP